LIKPFLISFLLCFNTVLYSQVLDSLSLSKAIEYKNLKEALINPEEVYRLNLRKKKLKSIPPEVFLFKNLNYLELSSNRINNIPKEISSLANLQYLYIGKNKIESIPIELTQLKHLKVLSLNRNGIKSLPKEIGSMYSLRILDLWGTDIVVLPNEIALLKHTLEIIDMRVIYMNRREQEVILNMFPNTKILFSKACNCN